MSANADEEKESPIIQPEADNTSGSHLYQISIYSQFTDSSEQIIEERTKQGDKVLQYKYVIVGAGTAGYAALKEIQSLDPDAQVNSISYH